MIDVCGYLAAVLAALAFYMKSMVTLRLLALGSNAAFIIYGVGLGLTPVWVLHCCLLPLNLTRLLQAVASSGSNVAISGPNRPPAERSLFANSRS
jgi:CRP/FNR family transcriptional regulator, cyclic AMP receptor protein